MDELVQRLEGENFAVVRPESDEEFAQYGRQLTVPEAPEGYASVTAAVLDGKPVLLTLDRRGEGLGTDFDRLRVRRAVYGVVADLAVLESRGEAATADAVRELAEMPRALTLTVVPAGKREDPPSGFSQAVPGTMVMFTMLVLLTSGSILLVIERERGLLRRLASTPISRGSVVLGKWAGKMCLGIVQIGFAMAVGRVLFRVDWGSALAMVGLVLLAWAAFNAALAVVLANLARTQAQTAGIGVLATMVLAALGGAWWPIEITPGWMQTLALFLPTGWTMDAMHELVNFGYGAAAAIPHSLGLAAAAAVLGAVATRTFRYQ